MASNKHSYLGKVFAAEPLATGKGLIKPGLKPGPRFKEILETIQNEQLEGRIWGAG